MTAHDEIRELLSLAAAGALSADEDRRLAVHLRSCSACAAELASWQAIGVELRRILTPQAPAALVVRTIAHAQMRFAEESDRRSERRVLALVIVFSWAFVAVSWPVAQLLGHGWMSLFGLGFEQGWKNFAVFTALCWLGGAAAAIVLANRRQHERRLA
ncbi:MAG TPA: zf-HC2 domain-containing protein [Candidatus Limnocylindrales bacterium]|nr:zf-HC2 domain-containing protein [Candidatus Limnocylindrales bacterium]